MASPQERQVWYAASRRALGLLAYFPPLRGELMGFGSQKSESLWKRITRHLHRLNMFCKEVQGGAAKIQKQKQEILIDYWVYEVKKCSSLSSPLCVIGERGVPPIDVAPDA